MDRNPDAILDEENNCLRPPRIPRESEYYDTEMNASWLTPDNGIDQPADTEAVEGPVQAEHLRQSSPAPQSNSTGPKIPVSPLPSGIPVPVKTPKAGAGPIRKTVSPGARAAAGPSPNQLAIPRTTTRLPNGHGQNHSPARPAWKY